LLECVEPTVVGIWVIPGAPCAGTRFARACECERQSKDERGREIPHGGLLIADCMRLTLVFGPSSRVPGGILPHLPVFRRLYRRAGFIPVADALRWCGFEPSEVPARRSRGRVGGATPTAFACSTGMVR